MEYTKSEFKKIDIEGLSRTLAEQAWNREAKDIPGTELYDILVIKDPHTGLIETEEYLKSEWVYLFFQLQEDYKELIDLYVKDIPCNSTQKFPQE